MPKFPGLVERIQEALGVKNQTEIADKLGITPASVSGWKRDGFVSIATLLKVAELSNASINWLLTGNGPKTVLESGIPALRLTPSLEAYIVKEAKKKDSSKEVIIQGLLVEAIRERMYSQIKLMEASDTLTPRPDLKSVLIAQLTILAKIESEVLADAIPEALQESLETLK